MRLRERATYGSQRCCGWTGTYPVPGPTFACLLHARQLANLAPEPDVIVTANIGCIQHLQTDATTPVRHCVEVLDAALA